MIFKKIENKSLMLTSEEVLLRPADVTNRDKHPHLRRIDVKNAKNGVIVILPLGHPSPFKRSSFPYRSDDCHRVSDSGLQWISAERVVVTNLGRSVNNDEKHFLKEFLRRIVLRTPTPP